MSKIDTSQLVSEMLKAAQSVLKKKWPESKDYAESEFKKIAEAITFIEQQRLLGKMNDEQAKLHLDIQKNATKTVLLTLEGLGTLAVEAAINAALDVIRGTVNKALGFAML